MKTSRILAWTLAALMALAPMTLAEKFPDRGPITWETKLQDVLKIEQEIDKENPPEQGTSEKGEITSFMVREHVPLLGTKADVLVYLFNGDQLVQLLYDTFEKEGKKGGKGYHAMLAKFKEMYGEPVTTDAAESIALTNLLADDEVYQPEHFKGYHEWIIDGDTQLSIFYRADAYVVSYLNYPWATPYIEQLKSKQGS